MGEYAKTNERIGRIEEQIKRLKYMLTQTTNQVELERLYDKIGELEIELGEARGYLAELNYIDNGGNY